MYVSRRMVLEVAACAVTVLLGSALFSLPGRAQDRRPNVVLIVADDLGYSDLGSFGGEIKTPNLDSLASVGIRFTQFYTSAVCSPSRSMMLTGSDNHIAGLGNMAEFTAPNQKGKPGYEGHLNDHVVSVASLLKDSGYHTYMAGKWHLGEEPNYYPAARGFSRDLTLIPGGGSYFDDMWGERGQKQPYTQDGKLIDAVRPGFYSTEDYTDAIIKDIEDGRADGKPFFAYLAYQAPHDPFQLPDDWLDKYKGRYDRGYDVTRAERIERMKRLGILHPQSTVFPRLPNVPAWVSLSDEERRQSARKMELYAAMVENMDSHIGRLFNYLREKNIYDNTLIIFLADNGPEGNKAFSIGSPWDNSKFENWGKKGTFIQYGPAWAQVSAGMFRDFKGFLSEGGIRAPMIISGYGVNDGGRTSSALAHIMDITPTILAVAGAAHPAIYNGQNIAPLQGKSLVPVLNDTRLSVRGPSDWLGWEIFGNRALRQGDWKLVWICPPHGPGDWQLYDVNADPAETKDLARMRPDIKEKLRKHWVEYAQTNNVILPNVSPICGKGELPGIEEE